MTQPSLFTLPPSTVRLTPVTATNPTGRPRSFDGPKELDAADHARLGTQLDAIFGLMRDGQWRTLAQIAAQTAYPEASVSAQLRHLRKPRFGSHDVDRRRVAFGGAWEYRLSVKAGA